MTNQVSCPVKGLRRKTALLSLSFAFAFCSPGVARAEEIVARVDHPFLLPQTNIFIGSIDKSVSIQNSKFSTQYPLDQGGLNTYGFDIEINSTRFLNLGVSLRVENLAGGGKHQFSTVLGGFTRFFYIPSFLSGKSYTTSLFTRLDLGIGPTILGEPMGILAQGGAHIGIETYFNKWFGLGISYGQILELGKETLVSQNSTLSSALPQYQNATFWNHGRVFQVSLKTTFF